MEETCSEQNFFGTARIRTILWKIAPPVMLAQLIQALYNVVDSFFVGHYSDDALTAVTVIYPLQLVIVALAVGTGVGVNTYMARKYAHGEERKANGAAGTGMVLELLSWAIFAAVSLLIMRPYVRTSATEAAAIDQAVCYGRIVCVGSLGIFLESNWSKVHQARGNMRLPMIAQVLGALTNVVLDPVLIFGLGPLPELGIAGAAYATVIGQCLAALIVGVRGFCRPPDRTELRHTVYIAALNMILAGFSDAAVTVLGLYYKMQSFFFIPLFGLQTCIVPVLSFNYARAAYGRCREVMRQSLLISLAFMTAGTVCFLFFPEPILRLFSDSPQVLSIGRTAFPIIGSSFFAAVFSLMMPVFFQAIGDGVTSMFLSLLRQIVLLVPVFWLMSKIGLGYTWLAFPTAEVVSGTIGMLLYRRRLRSWKAEVPGSQP